jgi:hypothetical protein
MLLHTHEVPVLPELGLVKVRDRHAQLRKPDELRPVKPRRVRKHPAPIDDRDRLVRAKKDLIYTHISSLIPFHRDRKREKTHSSPNPRLRASP